MALPKLDTPIFTTVLPSTNKKIQFRPFLVKEEKILLMALESGEEGDMVNAVKQILRNCILDDSITIESLPFFDLEYLFLNIRSKSVGEVIDITYRHPDNKNVKGKECEHHQDIQINIDDIKVVFPKEHSNKIEISDNVGIKLKYPTMNMVSNLRNTDNKVDQTFKMIYECVDVIWSGDEVFDEFTFEEFEEFVESMTDKQFAKIQDFFNNLPSLRHEFTYKCDGCGEEEKVVIEGLQSFFS